MKVSRVWVEFASETSKEDAIKKLASTPNMRVVYDYVGNFVSFVAASGPEESIQIMKESATGPAVRETLAATMKFPHSEAGINKTDWKIYESIRANPEKPQKVISKETGLGTRTIKRRLGLMTDKNVILIAPNLNPSKVDGVSADLLVRYKVPVHERLEDRIAAEVGESLIHVERFEEPCVLLTIIANNIPEAKELHRRISSVSGVSDARLYFVQDLIRMRKPLALPA